MSSHRALSGGISGRDTVVGTIQVDQGSIPKGKVKSLATFVSALKAGEENTSAERGNSVITAQTIKSDGITQITIDNLNSVDIENYNYYKISEAYLTKAKLITSDDKMNVKDKINYYLNKEPYNAIFQVAKPAPAGDATPDAPAAPTGDADPAATGGRKSRRSRKSRKSRKQRKSRRSRR
jgi:hypothetical protein